MPQPSPTRPALETNSVEIKATTTSMHACLRVPEILTLIFQNVIHCYQDGTRDGVATLTRVARTCRAFHEASIPLFWDELPGLHILVDLFPPDAFSWDERQRVYSLKAPQDIQTLPISKIQRYCSHVKILSYDIHRRLHHSVLLALYNSARNKVFFPKLEQAVIPCILDRPMETIFYPALVISPKLHRISFMTNAMYYEVDPSLEGSIAMEEQARDALERRLAPIAHQITTLVPSYHYSEFPMGLRQYIWTPAILDLINHLSDAFTTFDAGLAYVEIAALQGLARLSNLTTLFLTVQTPHLTAATSQDFELKFPALTTLNISFTVFPMSPFFERVEAPVLENLWMGVWDDTEAEIVLKGHHQGANGEQVAGVASIPIRYPLLKTLTMEVVAREIPLYFSLHPSGLRAFAKLEHLESLSIEPCIVSALMDQDIIDAFQAWPKLKTFVVCEDPCWVGISQTDLTLGGTRAAVDHCPHLTELGLPCDARMIPTFEPPFPFPSLQSWDFCNSPIASGRECAKWLHTAYPNLSQIRAFRNFRERIICLPSDDEGLVPPHALEGAQMLDQWNDVCSHSEAVIPMM